MYIVRVDMTYAIVYLSNYLSIFIRPIKDNLNANGHAVGQDSETKSTEHCPKYKQSTVI